MARPPGSRFRSAAIVAAALSLLAGAGPAPAPRTLPPLNEKVVEFTRAHVGKQVGNGVCITLAAQALKAAGARPCSFHDPNGDYVWGEEVPALKDALPGDILQFRDAVFQGKRWVTRQRWVSWRYEYPHHTAVVAQVAEGGKILTIWHQNVGGADVSESEKRLVRADSLRMDSLQKGGWVRVYRPVPLEPDTVTERDEASP